LIVASLEVAFLEVASNPALNMKRRGTMKNLRALFKNIVYTIKD
jgi:hypothetical protein